MVKLADLIDQRELADRRRRLRAKRVREQQEQQRRDRLCWWQLVSVAILWVWVVVVFFDALEQAMW